MSRPESKIDWQKVEELMIAGCHGTQVAAYFGIHPNTFYRRVEENFNISFSEFLQEKKSRGEALLRAHQFDKALGKTKKGDTQLLLMLGRERLGQRQDKDNGLEQTNELLTSIAEEIKKRHNPVVEE